MLDLSASNQTVEYAEWLDILLAHEHANHPRPCLTQPRFIIVRRLYNDGMTVKESYELITKDKK